MKPMQFSNLSILTALLGVAVTVWMLYRYSRATVTTMKAVPLVMFLTLFVTVVLQIWIAYAPYLIEWARKSDKWMLYLLVIVMTHLHTRKKTL